MFEKEKEEIRKQVRLLKRQQEETRLAAERAAKRQLLIDSFEKNKESRTDFIVKCRDREHNIDRTYYYGIPVFDGESLKGFNMMTFEQTQDENTKEIKTTQESPYTDEQGRQRFMTVDEFLEFRRNIERQSRRSRPAMVSVREYEDEQKEIEKIVLNNSKLAKVRNKMAKFADKTAEKMGMENIVKKITGGKKIEEVELNSKVKALEKTISDAALGKDR